MICSKKLYKKCHHCIQHNYYIMDLWHNDAQTVWNCSTIIRRRIVTWCVLFSEVWRVCLFGLSYVLRGVRPSLCCNMITLVIDMLFLQTESYAFMMSCIVLWPIAIYLRCVTDTATIPVAGITEVSASDVFSHILILFLIQQTV